ncbi:MAG: hypothetical protein ACREID_08190, partial [Planctomycetota bacterium]
MTRPGPLAVIALGMALGPFLGCGEPAAPPATRSETVLADRRYEQLHQGHRAAVRRVVWTRETIDGRDVIKDTTTVASRTKRMMLSVGDVFESHEASVWIRSEDGDLLSAETSLRQGKRTDRTTIRRTPGGYAVERAVGENREEFEIPSPTAVKADAEAFLGPKVASGEAAPGSEWRYPFLDVDRRRVAEAALTVVGPDDEGPGLKVVETVEGQVTLWWFAPDGAVERLRSGDLVIRRADLLDLEDLPRVPAASSITLPAGVALPRLFTTRRMFVEVAVRTDETTRLPEFPDNPFTRVIERRDGSVLLSLESHDDLDAKATIPVTAPEFAKYLEATTLMEVDDAILRAEAARAADGERDARKAAARIADHVFRILEKRSPDIPEPTAKEIL